MKKFVVLSIIIASLSFGGCRKCANCSYTYTDEFDEEYTYTYDEYCNSKKDLENFEDMVKVKADDLNGTYKCDIK